jgi:hypothetical protein
MKEKIDTQINLFEFYAEHEMGIDYYFFVLFRSKN